MSGREVDIGGEGPTFKNVRTKLGGKTSSFVHAKICSPKPAVECLNR